MSVCVFSSDDCKDCHDLKNVQVTGEVQSNEPVVKEPLKERPVEEVAARLAQQDQEETDILTCRLLIISANVI